MQITINSGNNRKSFEIPSVAAGKINQTSKIAREQAFDAVKSYLFRPAVLKAQAGG